MEDWVALPYLDFEPLLVLLYRTRRRRLAQGGHLVIRAVADRKLTQPDSFLGFLDAMLPSSLAV